MNEQTSRPGRWVKARQFVRDVWVNLIANLLAALIVYWGAIAVGLVPRPTGAQVIAGVAAIAWLVGVGFVWAAIGAEPLRTKTYRTAWTAVALAVAIATDPEYGGGQRMSVAATVGSAAVSALIVTVLLVAVGSWFAKRFGWNGVVPAKTDTEAGDRSA